MIRVDLESIWGMSANAYPPERQREAVNLVRAKFSQSYKVLLQS